jgi:hypothetical protein
VRGPKVFAVDDDGLTIRAGCCLFELVQRVDGLGQVMRRMRFSRRSVSDS